MHSAVLSALVSSVLTLLATWGSPLIQALLSDDHDKLQKAVEEKTSIKNENIALKQSQDEAKVRYDELVRTQHKSDSEKQEVIIEARANNRSLQDSLNREVQSRQEKEKEVLRLSAQNENLSRAVRDAFNILNLPNPDESNAEYLRERTIKAAEQNKADFQRGSDLGAALFGGHTVFDDLVIGAQANTQDAAAGEATSRYDRVTINSLKSRISIASGRLINSLSDVRVVLPSASETERFVPPSKLLPKVKAAAKATRMSSAPTPVRLNVRVTRTSAQR